MHNKKYNIDLGLSIVAIVLLCTDIIALFLKTDIITKVILMSMLSGLLLIFTLLAIYAKTDADIKAEN